MAYGSLICELTTLHTLDSDEWMEVLKYIASVTEVCHFQTFVLCWKEFGSHKNSGFLVTNICLRHSQLY